MPLQDTEKPIGIVVAVQEELWAILKRMSPAVVDSAGGIRVYRGQLGGKLTVITKSGMGSERAKLAAEDLISKYSAATLIVAGFCAGLVGCPGQIVIPSVVFDDSRDEVEIRPDAHHLALAEQVLSHERPAIVKQLLTSNRILRTREEKRLECRDGRSITAVDMETFGAANAAIRAGVPWLAVRVITDGQRDVLPLDFSRYTDQHGEVQRVRVAISVISQPWKIPAMVKLGMRSFLAARNLAEFVERYVAKL